MAPESSGRHFPLDFNAGVDQDLDSPKIRVLAGELDDETEISIPELLRLAMKNTPPDFTEARVDIANAITELAARQTPPALPVVGPEDGDYEGDSYIVLPGHVNPTAAPFEQFDWDGQA